MGAGTQSQRLGQEEILHAPSNSLPPPTHSPIWCQGLGRSDKVEVNGCHAPR